MVKFLNAGHIVLLFPLIAFTCMAQAQLDGPAERQTKVCDLCGNRRWLDTGIDLKPGDMFRISASGALHYPSYRESDAEGIPRGWRDLIRIYPLGNANHGALIGRVGDESAQSFLVGSSRESRAAVAGRLYLGLNQTESEHPEGSLHITIEINSQRASPLEVEEAKLPVLTQ
jgi:hypothetical protein